MALTRLSIVKGTMDSSGMASRTSFATLIVVWPIHSWHRESTNSTSTGTEILARTRPNCGLSQSRSMVRSEMAPFVVELRQLSNVQLPTGVGSGQGLFCAFSTASSWVTGLEQPRQAQLHVFPEQLHRQGALVLEGRPFAQPGLTMGTMLEIVTVLSESCS